MDHNRLSVGQVFTFQISVNSEKATSATAPPSPPKIKGVKQIHFWQNQETQTSINNTGGRVRFKTVHQTNYNFQYEAVKEGESVIEPFPVKVENKDYWTGRIVIKILPRDSKQSLDQSKGSGKTRSKGFRFKFSNPNDVFDKIEEQFDSFFKSPFGSGFPGSPLKDSLSNGPQSSEDAFLIKVEADKKEAYKGEQVLVSWSLYTQGRVRDIDTLKYPTLKGFWKEDIHLATHLNYEKEVVNGVSYNKALLASYALFPIDEGQAFIDPYQAKATIMGFNLKNFQTVKSSEQISILIKPLPLEGRPSHFSGGVGNFQMSVGVSDRSVVTNQPFSLKVRFEGMGNAKFIELPELPIGSDLEIYDIKNESQFFKNGQSFKEFEILLIPRQRGETMIGEIRTSYFDPKKEEYVSMNSKLIRLTVLQGMESNSMGEERLRSETNKKNLPGISMEWNPDFKPGSIPLFIWFFAGFAGLMVLLAKWSIDMGFFVKEVSLEEIINKRFVRLKILLANKRWRELGIEATNTLYYVMGHLSGQKGAGEEIEGVLAQISPSIRREIEEPIRKLMDFFNLLGFGPKSFVHDFRDAKLAGSNLEKLKDILVKACWLMKDSEDMDKNKMKIKN